MLASEGHDPKLSFGGWDKREKKEVKPKNTVAEGEQAADRIPGIRLNFCSKRNATAKTSNLGPSATRRDLVNARLDGCKKLPGKTQRGKKSG